MGGERRGQRRESTYTIDREGGESQCWPGDSKGRHEATACGEEQRKKKGNTSFGRQGTPPARTAFTS